MSNPYMEGASVKYQGRNTLRNPYPVDSPEWRTWLRGYNETYEADANGWYDFHLVKPEPNHNYLVWIVPGLDYYPSTPLNKGFVSFATFDGTRWIYTPGSPVSMERVGNRVTHWQYKPAPPAVCDAT